MRTLILVFLLALSITANAECEVNGYYRADGTWVNGYTKSGDCWHGKKIGYDAYGRSADERRAIQVEKNRLIIPFVLLLIILLSVWDEKLAEGSRLKSLISIIIFPVSLYLIFMLFLDPIIIIIIIFGFFAWNWIKNKRKVKQTKIIREKKKNYLTTTAISNTNNIKSKFQLFDYLSINGLIYYENQSYKLTEKGKKIGGEYRTNKNGSEWIVWKKNCLDDYIYEFKNLNDKDMSENSFISTKSKVLHDDPYLEKDLNLEFIKAKINIIKDNNDFTHISRELAIALYKTDQREQRYNDITYTVFFIDNLGVMIKKLKGIADDCRLVSQGVAFYHSNKGALDRYYADDLKDDLKDDLEDDLFG